MLLNVKRIEGFGGRAIFERAIFKTPFRYKTNLIEEKRACFFYIVEGEYSTYSSTNQVQLQSKDGVVKQCGPYVSEMLGNVQSGTCEAIAVYFYEDVLKGIYHESPDLFEEHEARNMMRKIASNDLVDTYIQSLFFYFDNPLLVDEQLVKLKLKELILLLLKTDKYQSVLGLMSDFFRPYSTSLIQIVENHLYSQINLEELAHLSNMSLSTFKREFRKLFNDSPAKYIRQRRLEKAARLLVKSDQQITSIAFDCGFNNLAHFSTVFRENYGMSPKNYRQDQIQNS